MTSGGTSGLSVRLRAYRAMIPAVVQRGGPFVGSFGFRSLGLLLGFGVNVLLARLLGPVEFGAYTFAFTVVSLLAVPLHDGAANLLMREVARDAAAGAWGSLRGAVIAANLFVMLGAAAVIVIVAPLVWVRVPATERSLWWLTLALLPLYSLANLRGAVLLGLARPVLALIPDLIVRPSVLALALVIGGAAGWRVGATSAMGFHVGAASCAFLVGTAFTLHVLRRQVPKARAAYRPRAWLRSLGPFSLISGVQITNTSLAVLFLNYFSTKPEISSYRIAFLGASLLGIGVAVGTQILAPQIAELHARGTPEQLQRRVRTVTRFMLGAALLPAIGLLIFSHPLIHLIFGEQYIGAQAPIVVLVLGQLLAAGTGAVGILLFMTGHENSVLRVVIATMLINVALEFAFVPQMGALGAAIASTVAMAASSLGMIWQATKLTGIRCTPW